MQLSTLTVSSRGKHRCIAIADRNYDRPAIGAQVPLENGGTMPSLLADDCLREVESVAEACAEALGVADGITKGDLVWTYSGPKVIEVAARLPGSEFLQLILMSTGINAAEMAIRLAMGREVEMRAPLRRFAACRYLWPTPGRLVSIEGVDRLMEQPWCGGFDQLLPASPGDPVPIPGHFGDRFARFYVIAESRKELRERVAEAERTVSVKTEPAVISA